MIALKIFIIVVIASASLIEGLKLSSLEKTYEWGLKAYSGERWTKCIEHFEESIHLYKVYKTVVINCRHKCDSPGLTSVIKDDIDDFKIYERFFSKRDCLLKCKEKDFEDVQIIRDIKEDVLFNMQARKPYEYLQLCYFQMYNLPKAASAAYTYLAANPNDEAMNKNLKYYMDQPEVDIKEVVDLESEDYVLLYNLGRIAYRQNNWAEIVGNMEETLSDYLSSENDCRVECENQPDQEQSSEFSITISNHIAALLYCRQQCQDKLKKLDYDSGVEFLADVLNYLQISYYHLERYEDAAKSVASYLALLPNDEDMLENKKIYSTLIDIELFTERSDIVYYFKRDNYEKKLLDIFHQGDDHNVSFDTI
ncbi:hypothetical protein K1T71_001877 [Dendrolimus kikuchii]|uniref:Uncharacterized protein n=1 Tax=Dendrolimus kikuchii TaxID=765133 RepID=A0ACC1DEY5_9NEOP|nr:hypothetical protein K1T71_001877 [Dendrolimus kikuchii]